MKHFKYIACLAVGCLCASCADETYVTPERPEIPAYQTDPTPELTLELVLEDGIPVIKTLPENVRVEVNGKDISIINQNTTNELTFLLSGTQNGSIRYEGNYKCRFILNGVTLKSTNGAALSIECGKRVAMTLAEGTENIIEDAAGGEQKAALYCKGHLEIGGAGSLSVTGNSKHAIATKEYLQLKRSLGSLTIEKAAGDALHVGQYFDMNGGELTFTKNVMGDGIQVETLTLEDDVTPDPEKEMNGQVMIDGGKITGEITQEDCKGIKCDDLITINGGTIDLKAKGKGSRGIQTKGNMTINEVDADIPTSITIAATGAKCTDVDKHKCTGIKVENHLLVTGGTTKVTASTLQKANAIRVGSYQKTGGTVTGTVKEDEEE